MNTEHCIHLTLHFGNLDVFRNLERASSAMSVAERDGVGLMASDPRPSQRFATPAEDTPAAGSNEDERFPWEKEPSRYIDGALAVLAG